MQEGGALANTFGWLVGVGPGAGFGLLIFLCGIGGMLVGVSGYLVKDIRDLDRQIPDFSIPNPMVAMTETEAVLIARTGLDEPDTFAKEN